ncbi:hypothetical protein AAMO2058_001538000 [Amorphochlora amoebiformis]
MPAFPRKLEIPETCDRESLGVWTSMMMAATSATHGTHGTHGRFASTSVTKTCVTFEDSGASKGEKGGKREEGVSGSTSNANEGKKTAFGAASLGSPNGGDSRMMTGFYALCEPCEPLRGTLEQLVFNILQKKHKKKAVTREEVEKHNTRESAWCIVAGHVLDMTPMIKLVKRHPGGIRVLMRFAGKDATKPFERFHYPRGAGVKWGSESMYVGPLDEGEKKDNGSA